MKYLGGKVRVSKKIAPILEKALMDKTGLFYEPFVGGFNIVPALSNVSAALCSDNHYGLINLYTSLQKGYEPPDNISEEYYIKAKKKNDWNNPETAFIAFGCSFGGKEWGGYARGKKNNGESRNYAGEAKRLLMKKSIYMLQTNVNFEVCDYREIIPIDAVVYCDPPYKGTTKYKTGLIDYDEFYLWCEAAAQNNCLVFVSEFHMPKRSGWNVVWEMERKISVTGKKQSPKVNKELLIQVHP